MCYNYLALIFFSLSLSLVLKFVLIFFSLAAHFFTGLSSRRAGERNAIAYEIIFFLRLMKVKAIFRNGFKLDARKK